MKFLVDKLTYFLNNKQLIEARDISALYVAEQHWQTRFRILNWLESYTYVNNVIALVQLSLRTLHPYQRKFEEFF